MASRIGGGDPSVMVPPPGVSVDNRSEQRREQMIKELQERELVKTRGQAEHVVDQLMQRLRPDGGGLKVAPLNPDGTKPGEKRPDDKPRTDGKSRDADAQRPDSKRADAPRTEARPEPSKARPQDVPKAVADFQRENGLPVTGKLDAGTLQSLTDKGLVTLTPAPKDAPAAPKAPVSASDQAAARKLHVVVEKEVKVRAEKHEPRTSDKPTDKLKDAPRPDPVADPARLIASLVSAGFLGKKGALEEGIKAFQAMFGLPLTGKLDAQTADAMKTQGLVEHAEHDATPPKTPAEPPKSQQNVKRALNEPVKSSVADKNIERDTTRQQATTKQPTTSNDVAARAPSTAASDASEQMRLDSVLAQQQATERGVQEATGDPQATKGQGATEGKGQGVSGKGGVEGGGAGTTGAGAAGPSDGPAGDESAVGNSKAGDDDFLDEARGTASSSPAAENVEDGEGEGHYEVPPLSEQVVFALAAIARDDDGSGPVTYTWDVTFYRPGVYAALQPAEEIWHVVVAKATAFDPVWQQASDAIASKMLYMEPDGLPPTLDDFVLALKRARVA